MQRSTLFAREVKFSACGKVVIDLLSVSVIIGSKNEGSFN